MLLIDLAAQSMVPDALCVHACPFRDHKSRYVLCTRAWPTPRFILSLANPITPVLPYAVIVIPSVLVVGPPVKVEDEEGIGSCRCGSSS